MKLLLHVCCAPCANAPIEKLRQEGTEVTSFWYNPNIHPFTEHKSRKNGMVAYSQAISLPLVIGGEYGLRSFLSGVGEDIEGRCRFCYQDRLETTAKYAKENGFDGFTTTLMISPYQNHDLMKEIAEEMAEKHQIPFIYQDFRPLFREGQQRARELEIYMQKYCGCIFSEEERYQKKKK
ncbi:MAG: epoxyqueuosine reductase QueH [Eubacteriales bacterium]